MAEVAAFNAIPAHPVVNVYPNLPVIFILENRKKSLTTADGLWYLLQAEFGMFGF